MEDKEIWVLGPGSSLNNHPEGIRDLKGKTTLAFQNVFPHCYNYFDLIPDIWVSGDPNAYMDGFKFLDNLSQDSATPFKNMNIIVPHFSSGNYAQFRKYCGTTPLGRKHLHWKKYLFLLDNLKNKGYNINIVDCTTTKFIKTFPQHEDFEFNNSHLFGDDCYIRFMYHKPIFGTTEYDSESVIGSRFKWGLENKLSSVVFPVCYYLGAKKVYIAGFDLKGGRFYSEDTRHPWTDETQNEPVYEFPLSLIKKWVDWAPYHGMEFYSIIEKEHTLLNSVIQYKKFLGDKR